MGAPLAFFALDAGALVLLGLVGLRVLLARPREPAAQLTALLCVAAAAHVVLARDDYSYWMPVALQYDVGPWRPVLNVARNAAPGLFMLLVHRLFTDRPGAPRLLMGLFGLQLFLEEPLQAFLPVGTEPPRLIAEALPAALQALFAGLAIYWTIESWRRDLVETRRWARALIAVILGVHVVGSTLFLRVLIAPDTAANYQAHLVLSLVAFAAVAGLTFALMRPDPLVELSPASRPRPTPTAEARDLEALASLARAMEVDAAYRDPALSLAGLAARVQLPQYRLRRLIHRELGFRNFSAFLHHYRIGEACCRLSDPDRRRTPILTIALDVGYGSVNTFNRGFREVTGVSPSEFRADVAPETMPSASRRLTET